MTTSLEFDGQADHDPVTEAQPVVGHRVIDHRGRNDLDTRPAGHHRSLSDTEAYRPPMLSIALAALSGLVWGVGDFAGGKAPNARPR